MELREKLLNIQTELKCSKNQYNSFGKYAYRSCEDILEAVKPLLAKYKTLLTLEDEIFQTGERYFVQVHAILQDCESEQVIAISGIAELDDHKGMSKDQSSGACSSYARKYTLSGLFLLDDNKDADSNEITSLDKGITKKEAKEYKITFGKYNGKTLSELIESNPDYIDWIINNSKDAILLQAIELLTGKKKMTDEELEVKAHKVATIMGYETKGVDLDKIKKTYLVNSISDMTEEQMNDCIEKLSVKYGE